VKEEGSIDPERKEKTVIDFLDVSRVFTERVTLWIFVLDGGRARITSFHLLFPMEEAQVAGFVLME